MFVVGSGWFGFWLGWGGVSGVWYCGGFACVGVGGVLLRTSWAFALGLVQYGFLGSGGSHGCGLLGLFSCGVWRFWDLSDLVFWFVDY